MLSKRSYPECYRGVVFCAALPVRDLSVSSLRKRVKEDYTSCWKYKPGGLYFETGKRNKEYGS